ncbi:MAG: hypothetical protein AAF066_17345 [Pseudomonadota bacterium]
MSDLIDDPSPGENAPEFSVSELSGAIKRVIEGEFAFVRVKGEVHQRENQSGLVPNFLSWFDSIGD